MTTKRFPFYRDLINLSLLYMLTISFFMALATRIHIPMMPLEFIGIGFVFLCCYLICENVRWLWVYVVLHFAVLGSVMIIPLDSAGKLCLMVLTVVIFIRDLHTWLNHDKSIRDLHAGMGLLFIPALLYTSIHTEFGYAASIYYMGVAFVVLILIRNLLANFYELTQTGQLDDDMPVKEIFRNDTLITAVIIALITGAMLFVRADKLILALNRLGYALWRILSNFLSRTSEGGEQPDIPQVEYMDLLLEDLATQEEDVGFFGGVLRIIVAGLMLMCIVMVVYCIGRMLLYFVWVLLEKKGTQTKPYKTFKTKNEVRQSLREEAIKERRHGIFRTPYEKFRNLYRSEMKKQKKAGADVRNTRTPEENRVSILSNKGIDLRDATDLYEQFRYSTEAEVTTSDVTDLKNRIKSAGG